MQVRASLVRRRQMAANTEMGMVCDTTVKHTVKRGLLLCCLFDRTDYCATWLCPPHPLLTLGKAFVTANYYVQFSKLKSNSVFTCIRWRMDSVSHRQRGKRMRRTTQWCTIVCLGWYPTEKTAVSINAYGSFSCVQLLSYAIPITYGCGSRVTAPRRRSLREPQR